MPRDECIVCDRHFPGGEGLEDGRCPPCAQDFRARQAAKIAPPPSDEEPSEEV